MIVQHINENSGKDENGSTDRRDSSVWQAQRSATITAALKALSALTEITATLSQLKAASATTYSTTTATACGALQSDIKLARGETKELIYVLGQKDPRCKARRYCSSTNKRAG